MHVADARRKRKRTRTRTRTSRDGGAHFTGSGEAAGRKRWKRFGGGYDGDGTTPRGREGAPARARLPEQAGSCARRPFGRPGGGGHRAMLLRSRRVRNCDLAPLARLWFLCKRSQDAIALTGKSFYDR
ncbi:TPA: hypothetical protein QDB02_002592 [Burkholderia vietnamiensis]|nr:hypothetical protein [Burkholderia vietnamiensis]